tara:strand:- start:85 stop:270 length:186 start_codon:yes stop_codon:yes gene_type:complete
LREEALILEEEDLERDGTLRGEEEEVRGIIFILKTKLIYREWKLTVDAGKQNLIWFSAEDL